MSLSFYDTRKKSQLPFTSLTPKKVRLYTCGPTVYAPAHIGNFRTYMFEDLLRRTLKFLGYEVYQVMNLTDIDDKTIRAARERGVSLNTVTDEIIEHFYRDLDKLKIERAEVYPRATEHVTEMIGIIQQLLEKGYAYEMDGSIYFSIAKYPQYGELSGMKLQQLERGVRIDADEYDKENFRDFALWKSWTPEDGDVYWDSPFGKGRPGWHIECSAMSMKYLGEEFDIHTGGVDNIFPHHENEIAQSVCATGQPFAQWWLHSAHLSLEGEKMSKSLGNTFTLTDLEKKGYSMRVLRYVLISVHYRQRLVFTDEVVKSASSALERLDTLWILINNTSGSKPVRQEINDAIEKSLSGFSSAMSDDLNISAALSYVFDFVSNVHRLNRDVELSNEEGNAVVQYWRELDKVLGVLLPWEQAIPNEIIELVHKRNEARKSKNFNESDRIRGELSSRGFSLEDSHDGTVLVNALGRTLIKKR